MIVERKPRWFTILSGKDQGRRHLAGWMLTAIKTEGTGAPRDDGWLSLAVCPRCFAVVIDDDRHAYGELSWHHEQWHADTDYPDPERQP